MRKNDLKKEMASMLNNRKFLNAITIALVLAFVLLAISSLSSGKKKNYKPASGIPILEESEGENEKTSEVLNYEKAQKEELKNILVKMDGVGQVEVMMYFESSEVKVPAVDSNTQTSVTEEMDREGGKRVNNQQTDGSKVVMSGNGSENEPLILQTYKPKITGIVIVAEGAESSKVRYDVQTAISSLYGIPLDKVNVYPMKR